MSHGELDGRGPAPTGPAKAGERLVDQPRYVLGAGRVLGPPDGAAEHRELVGDLVKCAATAAEVAVGHLTDEAQHRRVARIGRGERGAGVEHARPRHHGAHPDSSGRPRVAVGHVGGGLLVAGVNDADAPVFGQGVEEPVQLHAGQPEDDIHAPTLQPLDDELSACRHDASPPDGSAEAAGGTW